MMETRNVKVQESGLQEETIQAIGWTWAEACEMVERGEDIRQAIVPDVLARAEIALRQKNNDEDAQPTDSETRARADLISSALSKLTVDEVTALGQFTRGM